MSRYALVVFFFFFSLFGHASIIKVPPTGGETTYGDLVCTEQDKANIYEIITTMAENGKISLLLKQGHLKALGAQINHVHPLKFLTSIFTNPRLKFCMFDLFDDYFKRNGFMDGLAPSLEKEAERGKLINYLNDFSIEMNIPADDVRPYFLSRDWENFVRFLMQSP